MKPRSNKKKAIKKPIRKIHIVLLQKQIQIFRAHLVIEKSSTAEQKRKSKK